MASFLDGLKWPLNQLAAYMDPMTHARTREPFRNWLTGPVARDDRYWQPINDGSSLATVINSLIPHPGQSEEGIIAGTTGFMLPAGGVRAARELMRGPVPESVVNAIGWHGSPHKFPPTPKNALGEFDASKIGTGEGAQAYGHGLYFAENPEVAKQYQPLGQREFRDGPLDWDNPVHAGIRAADLAGGREAGIARLSQTLSAKTANADNKRIAAEAIEFLKSGEPFEHYATSTGNLYKVDIPDEKINAMLDWDKPLGEHPKAIREALSKAMIAHPDEFSGRTGGDVMTMLRHARGEREASGTLKQLGIPGIRYLDGGSRGAGQGTSNYVVFDPSITNILARE